MPSSPTAPAPIAYLTGEYPKVSHTFIQREVAALRAQGLTVLTCTVRRAAAKDVLADQKAEEAATFCILEAARNPARLIGAHLAALRRAPKAWFSALFLAWRTRPPGAKAALYQLFYFLEAGVLAQHLRREGVGHLHNHFGNSSCSVAMLTSVISGIPYSFTEHGPAIFFEAGKWRLDEKIARARFVVAISHFCRSQLMLFSDPRHWKKIVIVHCGVDPALYGRSPRGRFGKHVLFVGRLDPVKGVPLLLEAFAAVRRRHPDARLTVVGDGAARPAAEAQASRTGARGGGLLRRLSHTGRGRGAVGRGGHAGASKLRRGGPDRADGSDGKPHSGHRKPRRRDSGAGRGRCRGLHRSAGRCGGPHGPDRQADVRSRTVRPHGPRRSRTDRGGVRACDRSEAARRCLRHFARTSSPGPIGARTMSDHWHRSRIMIDLTRPSPAPRRVFILMSSHALPYGHLCIRTMIQNAVEPVQLRLIGDDAEDAKRLSDGIADIAVPQSSTIDVIPREEVTVQLAARHPHLKGLRALHDGHPCWRKITDPLVLSEPQDEVIVADPDLFFPNRFTFEPTLRDGVMMMRQGPNCLYPPDAVRAAFGLGVKLANHVDIGVAQVRAGAVDLDWLDWFARGLDLDRFRPFMHIEAIVWSALAMRMGGVHLDPGVWRCWERGKIKRVAVTMGLPGVWTLRLEAMHRYKCIHVSGPAKWWVTEAIEKGVLRDYGNRILAPSLGVAYRELTRNDYEREQSFKHKIKALGLYRITGDR